MRARHERAKNHGNPWFFFSQRESIDQLSHFLDFTTERELVSFNPQPTPLQEAFLAVGINLQQYQQLLPDDPVKYRRHTAILAFAMPADLIRLA
jgi:hypothetical protein